MSALEKLIARYQRDLIEPEREHLRRAELEAMQIYNEICDELAEKIREDFRREFSRATTNLGVSPAQRWFAGGDRAADLIDPEHDGS